MSYKHSPLPWIPTNKRASTNYITDAEGIVIAEIFWDRDESRDRDFIIDCCNNYEKLLELNYEQVEQHRNDLDEIAALQTNYNNLLQQCEGQAGVIRFKDAKIIDLKSQIDAVKEIFPKLLDLIDSHGVDGAKIAIDNCLEICELSELNDWMKDELEAAKR